MSALYSNKTREFTHVFDTIYEFIMVPNSYFVGFYFIYEIQINNKIKGILSLKVYETRAKNSFHPRPQVGTLLKICMPN